MRQKDKQLAIKLIIRTIVYVNQLDYNFILGIVRMNRIRGSSTKLKGRSYTALLYKK